jgi:hypothetical protein
MNNIGSRCYQGRGVMLVRVGTLLAFGLVALGMVCSPGPNMVYLISRSITRLLFNIWTGVRNSTHTVNMDIKGIFSMGFTEWR